MNTFGHELGPVAPLIGSKLHGRVGAALVGCLRDGVVDLHNLTIKGSYDALLNRYLPLDFRHAAADRGLALDLVLDVSLCQETVTAHCVEAHQDHNENRERCPQPQ